MPPLELNDAARARLKELGTTVSSLLDRQTRFVTSVLGNAALAAEDAAHLLMQSGAKPPSHVTSDEFRHHLKEAVLDARILMGYPTAAEILRTDDFFPWSDRPGRCGEAVETSCLANVVFGACMDLTSFIATLPDERRDSAMTAEFIRLAMAVRHMSRPGSAASTAVVDVLTLPARLGERATPTQIRFGLQQAFTALVGTLQASAERLKSMEPCCREALEADKKVIVVLSELVGNEELRLRSKTTPPRIFDFSRWSARLDGGMVDEWKAHLDVRRDGRHHQALLPLLSTARAVVKADHLLASLTEALEDGLKELPFPEQSARAIFGLRLLNCAIQQRRVLIEHFDL